MSSLIPFGLAERSVVLDIASGHGIFLYKIIKSIKKGEFHAVGLKNDIESFYEYKNSLKPSEYKFIDKINYHLMDARNLKFPSEYFDFVVNFLGLEDIHMTSGIQGVQQSLKEAVRVLKPNGTLLITVCLEGEEEDQKLAKEISSFIGHNAVFQSKEFYLHEFRQLGIQNCKEKWYYTHRKMTPNQAIEEFKFACVKTPKIFQEFGVHTVDFNSLWDKFKIRIRKYGVAYYSELCVLIGKK